MSRGQVATKKRAVAKPTYSVEQLTAKPKEVFGWRMWLQGLCAGAALLGCLWWMGAGRGLPGLAIGLAAAGVAVAAYGSRQESRAAREAAAHTTVMQQLHYPVLCEVTWPGVRGQRPSKLVIDYPPLEHEDSTESDITAAVNAAWAPWAFTSCRPKTRIEAALPAWLETPAAAARRVRAVLRRPVPVSRVVLFAYDPSAPGAEPEQTPLEVLEGTILDRTELIYGDEAKVVDVEIEGDQVTDFVVEHRFGPRLVDERIQIATSMAMSQMLPGQWGSTFDLERDRIHFHWRRPLPKMVANPVDPDLGRDSLIALGQNEDGQYAVWDFDGVFAHLLLSGRTRTGKSVLLRTILFFACRLGHRCFIIDPKRIEFVAMRDWPNVEQVASAIPDQLALLIYLRELMMERYRLIEEEGYAETDFERIFVIIDEYKQFTANVSSWWRQNKVTGMPAACPIIEYVGDLLRLAAAARIHVVLGTQRPDADTVGGEVRDNFSARCSTGSLSPDGARMMYDSERVGVAVPKVQGRGYFAGADDRPEQVQYFWTPNPRTAKSEADIAVLEALRPKTVTWPRTAWHYMTDEEALAWQAEQKAEGKEVKGSPAWIEVLNAQLGAPTSRDQALAEVELEALDKLEDDGDGYGPEETLCPSALVEGDLILLDDGDAAGEWVSVTEVRREGVAVWVGWLSGDDDGLMSTNDDIPIQVRHLLPFDDEGGR